MKAGYERTHVPETSVDVAEPDAVLPADVAELDDAELERVVGGLDYGWSDSAVTLFEP
jgi:hypothetical protein